MDVFFCLNVGNIDKNCLKKNRCNVVADSNGQMCGRFHHPLLHDDKINDFRFQVNSAKLQKNTAEALLMISAVKCQGQMLTTLWHSSSNVSLITRESVKSLV